MTVMRAASIAACLLLAGCGTFYVDDTIKEVGPSEWAKVPTPQPVQMLFEFQTKGARNSAATDILKKEADTVTKASGLFSAVSDAPVSSGAVLNLTINNVPLDDQAFAKGFVTGATFFIVGNTVGDGYVCTVEYLPPGGGAKIVKTARDAVYTSLGATASAPPHARKMKDMEDAARTMARKCLGKPLNELGSDLAKVP